ncbi:hypothetical protein [uncultured Sphingomonas sp.]|uniref:hypothetical protein n=1 Tax=uncultured Sphingomonas sp. TaxID=158754 RepID=UPI0026349417|nr:hypothetical protein [uncultured Sphingomonas sp.]
MSEREIVRLSRAIAARRISDGSYSKIIEGAAVSQPVVSLAAHRRLALRTEPVDRLFEFLEIQPDDHDAMEAADDAEQRMGAIMRLAASLSNGTDVADRRLVALLQAIGKFVAEPGSPEGDLPV